MNPLLVALVTVGGLKMRLVEVMRNCMTFQACGGFFVIREIPVFNLCVP